ncbi:MAG TPA: galactose oxidase-like domain-containing protein, partial [Terriglobia bacterium]|nr:galactose oxidase-like domain-containing protein [Terriglobia bacterium]
MKIRPVAVAHPQRVAAAAAQTGKVRSTPTQPTGTWTAPEESVNIMVHAALTRTGKVLMYGIPQGNQHPPVPWTPVQLYDPATDTVTDVSTTFAADMVCGGMSILPNGNFLSTGGAIVPVNFYGTGITAAGIFDPVTETWSQAKPMNYPRWYPSNVELGNGNTLVTTGHDTNPDESVVQMEVYNQNTGVWSVLPPSANNPDPGSNWLFPRLDVLPNGMVFKSAPRQLSMIFNPATNTWTNSAKLLIGDLFYTGHVLVPNTYTVMVIGGTPSNAGGGTTATATTESIDLSAQHPVWTYGPSLNVARFNSVVMYLADGSLIAVGGNAGPGKYGNPVYSSEIYSFATKTWTLMASQQGVRAYHSVGVLLPDGRVFSVGSTSDTTYDHDYEIFSPPYLYNGARPTITGSPASVTYGQQFTITTPDADNISSVALVMPGATTHANDMQQRYVP